MVGIQQSGMGRSGASDTASGVFILCAAGAAAVLSAVIVFTAAVTDAPLGAPPYWPWLLTGLQVLGLWSAGTGRKWGWLLGAAVQLPWIAYAVVTGQIGFIPGCAVSAAVQTYSFLPGHRRPGRTLRLPVFANGAGRTKEGTTWMSNA